MQPSCKTYIVILKDPVGGVQQIAEDHARTYGIVVKRLYDSAVKGYAAVAPAAEVDSLRADPRVSFVEVDQKVEAFDQETPTGIGRIFAPGNAEIGINGADDARVDADIAIIDTGIDPNHPDLNVVGRTDCTVGDPFAKRPADSAAGVRFYHGRLRPVDCLDDAGMDATGHGTHVAGTAAAIDDGAGVVGVAPGARLWAVKVLGTGGSGSMSQVLAGVDWVTAHASTIDVANMSLGCPCMSQALDDAIATSVAKGVVYVVAAGNFGDDASGVTPANHPDVITVSALADFDGEPGGGASPTCRSDEDDTLADFSDFGAVIDVAAPGVCIRSTWKGGTYETASGTSMASPHVAGAAALLSAARDPTDKAGVHAIRRTIREAGNHDWRDIVQRCEVGQGCTEESPDGVHEPLLDVRRADIFAPVSVGGPFNRLPRARFTRTCTATLSCSFDASASFDPDGRIIRYSWTFGDPYGGDSRRSTATGKRTSHIFTRSGTYVVRLTVTDDQGAAGAEAALVTVLEARTWSHLARPSCGAPGDEKCERWVVAYDNPNGYGGEFGGDDRSLDVAVSPRGDRVYVTGDSWDNRTQSFDIATAAYEAASGKRLWVARYDGPQGLDDAGVALAVSPDGSRLFVTGLRDADYFYRRGVEQRWDAVAVAYDTGTGQQTWVASVGSADGNDGAGSIAVSPDGDRVFIGASGCDATESLCEYATVAFDAATGTEGWTARYRNPEAADDYNYNQLSDLKVSPAGDRVFVTGTSLSPGDDFTYGYATVAYTATSGVELWSARYDRPDTSSFAATSGALGVSPDGSRVYVTGISQVFAPEYQSQYATVAYDATSGGEVWEATYHGSGAVDESRSLAVSPTGDRVYVTGYSEVAMDGPSEWVIPEELDYDAVTVAYDATSGAQAWRAAYRGRGRGSDEVGEAVTVSPDGSRVYIAASATTKWADIFLGPFDFATVALDAMTGTRVWTGRYNSAETRDDAATPTAIAVSDDGRRLYVTGSFVDRDDRLDLSDWGTVAYGTGRVKP